MASLNVFFAGYCVGRYRDDPYRDKARINERV